MTKARRHFLWLIPLAWVAAMTLALVFDRRVAEWVRDTTPVHRNEPVTHSVLFVLKLPGDFIFTLCVAALVAARHRLHLRAATALLLSGIVAGVFYSVIKWVAGRHRPIIAVAPFAFAPFPRGLLGLFHPEPALCFPSGHATLAFATAVSLALLMPRMAWIFFLCASITAAERVFENAHYLSDVVAGAGVGIFFGWVVTRAIIEDSIRTTRS